MFKDRKDAGIKLGHALEKYKGENTIVLGIPRGGVEVGIKVAEILDTSFSIIISRKLPFPDNPESGFGAVSEDGSVYMISGAEAWISGDVMEKVKKEQIQEIKRRIQILRHGNDLPELKQKTVILVDDGIAMGSTMTVSVKCCRNKNAGRIVIGSPVAGPRVAQRMEQLADDTVILEKPVFFNAVAQVYKNWHDVSDKEVLKFL